MLRCCDGQGDVIKTPLSEDLLLFLSILNISIHADQAKVNINVWLTPDAANLDKENGGLVIYDKTPPQDEVFGEGLDKWNNDLFESDRGKWLRDNDAQSINVPYRQKSMRLNRQQTASRNCAVFFQESL